MAIYIPLVAVLLAASLGVITYSVQKAFDRKNELIKLRQAEYKRFIETFQKNVAYGTRDTLADYWTAMLALFVVASDEVILKVGAVHNYFADTPAERRTRAEIDSFFVPMLKAMRNDCFERSQLEDHQISALLPYQA